MQAKLSVVAESPAFHRELEHSQEPKTEQPPSKKVAGVPNMFGSCMQARMAEEEIQASQDASRRLTRASGWRTPVRACTQMASCWRGRGLRCQVRQDNREERCSICFGRIGAHGNTPIGTGTKQRKAVLQIPALAPRLIQQLCTCEGSLKNMNGTSETTMWQRI